MAQQSDLNHDPANAFAQEFWLALVGRRLEYENRLRETEITPTPDTRALEDRDRRLSRFKRELEALSADETEVAAAWPSEQRAAMKRILGRWQERDEHAANLADASAPPEPKAPAELPLQQPLQQQAPEAYTACVASLRALADASPKYRTHTRKELLSRFKGPLSEKVWRDALREAFKDNTEWQKTGRRKL